ncbi:unnamed protein product [Ranitomeya imitator]|uniref:Uncharacterized protein n=1 Tax=Ranitomeya imitator TaxID=111125 RepID=A0ABN9LED4_9NEOB|nr:unnamed protein product [Ranitomeya imitator]
MALYDEDIQNNAFYLAIQKQRPDLISKVAEVHGIGRVGFRETRLSQKSSRVKSANYGEKRFSFRGIWLSSEAVSDIRCQCPFCSRRRFYNDKEESFSILCISRPIEKDENPEEVSAPSATCTLKNIDDVKEFLGKNVEKFDKSVASFRSAFKVHERKNLRHYIDSVNTLYTKCLQHLLRDSHLRTIAKQETQMNLDEASSGADVRPHGIYDLIFQASGDPGSK